MNESTESLVPDTGRFIDRVDAGRRLGQALAKFAGRGALVLGIPRGGIPVAAEVAKAIGGELDVIVARKLGAPGWPELAIGAVTSNGGRFLNYDVIQELGVSEPYIEAVTAEQRTEAAQRETRFRGGRPPAGIQDRVAILVDDGLATGATMRAAVQSIRQRRPAWLVVAVPVGARDSLSLVRMEADELICIYQPPYFGAVGAFYENFEPTEDDEVQALLEQARAVHAP